MVTLKNPEAPATSKQLWKIHQLTKEDTRDLDITMQEASDRISRLEQGSSKKQASPPAIDKGRGMPFQYAHVTFITGEQGSGKSVSAVARVRDAYDKDCVNNYCREILKIGAVVKWYDRRKRIAKISHNRILKLIRIPESYKLHSSLKIFCNFHLFGMRYTFIPSFQHLARWLEDGTIAEGYLVIDEYYLGGFARESMSVLTRRLAQLSQQFRKRQLEVIIMCQLARMADWTMRMTPTEFISCSYDEKTHKVTLQIRKKGVRGERKVSFDVRLYWGNYWTNELVSR